MRAVVQRVKEARVRVSDRNVGQIGPGFLVFLGVGEEDKEADSDYLADKIAHLRIFSDDQGLMNLSLKETGGGVLVVSQFTLYGDCRKGRRPSFIQAADPDKGNTLYEYFVAKIRERGVTTATGRFGAMMAVSLVNDGPVTLIVESK